MEGFFFGHVINNQSDSSSSCNLFPVDAAGICCSFPRNFICVHELVPQKCRENKQKKKRFLHFFNLKQIETVFPVERAGLTASVCFQSYAKLSC